MPQKPETSFYRRVNAKIPLEVHRQKISSLFANGTPDFWYSGFKADGWVEYKWLPKLSRNGVDPQRILSPLQLLWINRRYREGRLVLVVIGSPQGCVVLEDEAWCGQVKPESFSLSISDVSLFLSGKFNAITALP